jgi:gamma-glutamylcyclotransferase (GGCT)/AIG2-like uncharacterized protein YtfP
MSEKVFVYGTLRTGDIRFGVETFIEMLAPEAYLEGFDMLDLGSFPGLIPFDADNAAGLPRVRGEVHIYEHLKILDGIEGYDAKSPEKGFYNRQQVTVHTPDGDMGDCWVYTYNAPDHLFEEGAEPPNIIQSGDWFQRDKEIEA